MALEKRLAPTAVLAPGTILISHAPVRRSPALTRTPVMLRNVAGSVLTHGAMLATRTTADFEGLGVENVDPWSTDR
jgi:hypothetical protein